MAARLVMIGLALNDLVIDGPIDSADLLLQRLDYLMFGHGNVWLMYALVMDIV